MTAEELKAIQTMMEQVMDSKLQPIHERMDGIENKMDGIENKMDNEFVAVNNKLDQLQFQMDTVYNWVDHLDLDVKQLKKEA